MTHHPLPHSTIRRGRSWLVTRSGLPLGILRTLSVIAGLGGVAGVAAAEAPLPSPVVRPAGVSDAVLARSVLAAIDGDPELRGVNLVVSVVDRVVVIGGPVSSVAVAKRAEWVVRRVPDVTDVRNACFVTAGPDPLMKAVADRLGSSTLPPRPVMTDLPGVLTGPQTPGWATPAPAASTTSPNLVAVAPAGNTVVVRRPALPVGDAISVLGAPVGPVGAGTTPTPVGPRESSVVPNVAPGVLTGTAPMTSAAASDALLAAGEARKAEARFARLTVELRDGVFVVGGTAPRASDAWDFAQRLRQIPGVSRVAVGAVAGK